MIPGVLVSYLYEVAMLLHCFHLNWDPLLGLYVFHISTSSCNHVLCPRTTDLYDPHLFLEHRGISSYSERLGSDC